LKKHLLTCGILACAFFIQTQHSLAYSDIAACATCHPKASLHDIAGHTPCTICHADPAGAQDVVATTCAACHPAGNPGACSVVKLHDRLMRNCVTCHGKTAAASGVKIAFAGQTCSSCHTDCTGACPAVKVLGDENPGLATLCRFRDKVLAKNALGRQVIKLYYRNSAAVNAALESHPKLEAFAHKVLASCISVIALFLNPAF
jgi:hypothetical protein